MAGRAGLFTIMLNKVRPIFWESVGGGFLAAGTLDSSSASSSSWPSLSSAGNLRSGEAAMSSSSELLSLSFLFLALLLLLALLSLRSVSSSFSTMPGLRERIFFDGDRRRASSAGCGTELVETESVFLGSGALDLRFHWRNSSTSKVTRR